MLFLKIITIILGLAFLIFGYFICFKKRYDLINGFEDDLKHGRKDERYAARAGLIEPIAGIVLLLAGVLLLIFA